MDTRASFLFEQDALLPAQWEKIYGETAAGPYQRLGLALIEDALLTFFRPWTRRGAQRADEDAAIAWVRFAGSPVYPMNFNMACAMAFPDRDTDALREGMLRRMLWLQRERHIPRLVAGEVVR